MDPDCLECFGLCPELDGHKPALTLELCCAQLRAEQIVVGIALAAAQPYCF